MEAGAVTVSCVLSVVYRIMSSVRDLASPEALTLVGSAAILHARIEGQR